MTKFFDDDQISASRSSMFRALAASAACLIAAAIVGGESLNAAPPQAFQPATAKPLFATRPIFALPASSTRAAPTAANRPATQPLHRRVLTPAPMKGTAASASPNAKNAVPRPVFGTSAVPVHRRSLGW
jgi:hypothetical protein